MGRMMHKYEIIIYYSDDDGAFVAEAPELPGYAAHGDTHEAALKHINEAVRLWLETAREFSDHIPEPVSVWETKASPRKPLGQWLIENVPRGVELQVPDRSSTRPIPFIEEQEGK